MQGWVFPVGHYLGPFFPGPGEPMRCHRVRIGAEITSLLTDEEFAVWSLAHGVPGLPGGQPWARAAIVALVRERGGGDVTETLAELVAAGALAEVGDPAEFARAHRFNPLLLGLGASADRPGTIHIGLIGCPRATVDPATFELWQWAPLHASIWDLYDTLATTDGTVRVDDVLAGLHTLLTNGCGYLDLVTVSG